MDLLEFDLLLEVDLEMVRLEIVRLFGDLTSRPLLERRATGGGLCCLGRFKPLSGLISGVLA